MTKALSKEGLWEQKLDVERELAGVILGFLDGDKKQLREELNKIDKILDKQEEKIREEEKTKRRKEFIEHFENFDLKEDEGVIFILAENERDSHHCVSGGCFSLTAIECIKRLLNDQLDRLHKVGEEKNKEIIDVACLEEAEEDE